jgi:hypothetical protein
MLELFIKDSLFDVTVAEGDGLGKDKQRRLLIDMGGVIR